MLEPLYTSDEMKAAEAGHDVPTLMERAGRAVADEALHRFPRPGTFALYAGKGANGVLVHSQPLPTRSCTSQALAPAG